MVLDEVFVKETKIVSIRPKRDYYDLLRMSPAVPMEDEPARIYNLFALIYAAKLCVSAG